MNSLEPRIRYVWIISWFFLATFLAAMVSIVDGVWLGFIYPLGTPIFFILLIFGIIHSILRYRVWKYEVREDSLYLERGVFRRIKTVVPYSRIQHVDSQRGVFERMIGLSTLVVYTAGSRGADVNIPGLVPEHAENLQNDLKDSALEFDLGDEDAV